MKKLLIIATILICATQVLVTAQNKPEQRHKWMQEMTNAKVEFVNKELEITKEQKEEFNQLYKQYLSELHKIHSETHALRRSIEAKQNATDLEYETAADAMFKLKSKEGAINEKYYEKFKKILTSRQLFKFQKAEDVWTKRLMKYRKKRQK